MYSMRSKQNRTMELYFKKTNDVLPVKFIFIFAPKEEELHDVEHTFKSNKLIKSIYIDSQLAFEKCNPELSNSMHHTFLMDRKGKLLYVGDPTKSESNEKNLLKVLQVYAEMKKEAH